MIECQSLLEGVDSLSVLYPGFVGARRDHTAYST